MRLAYLRKWLFWFGCNMTIDNCRPCRGIILSVARGVGGSAMKSRLGIALAASALFSFCQLTTANAATIGLSSPSVDFGPVAIGSSSSPVVFTATAFPDPNNQVTSWGAFVTGTNFSDFPGVVDANPVNNCGPGSPVCALDLFFSPSGLGSRNANLHLSFNEADDAGVILQISAIVTLTGVGTEPAATPLPAALPMFMGGAGLIGLLVRRRKRTAKAA